MDTPLPRRSWPSQVRLLFVSLLTSAAMLAATPAAAATNTVVDCDSQSLQAAVDAAKPGDVLDIVNVPCSEDVTVNKNLTIRGDWPLNPEAGVSGSIAIGSAAHVVLENLEVSGNYGHRAITTAGTVTIRNSQLYGGGLAIEGGVATLIDSVVQESVSEFAQGGGIYSCGELSLTGGWIGDNFADEGAGIYVACGETTIVGTSLGENGASHGGAVFVAAATDPTVTITDSELTHNEGYQTGGAIHVAGGSVTVVSSRITDNIAEDGGGIYNVGGDVTVTSSLVQGNTAFVEPAFTEPILQTQRLSGPGPHLLEDVHIETTNGPCVEVSAGSEVTIRNVELGPCGAEGIVIDHSSGVDVHDSFIHPESTGESGVAIRATHSSDIEVTGNVLAHGSSNLFAFVVSDLRVADNLFVNPLGPYPTNKQIQVWGEPQTDGLNDPDLVNSIVVTIEDNVLITSVDPKWGPRPDPGDAINLGYTIDAEVSRNHIIGGHGFQACGIITDHATVSGARILDNVLVGTAQCGIGIAGGEDIEVSGNSILNGHVNTPYPGGNVAMYAHNFYASETPTCDAITIEGNTATAIFRDGSYRNFDHPPAGSSGICTDAAGQPVTRAAVAADNLLGEAAAALLDPAYRTRPVPYLPPQPSRDIVVSPYVAGPGRPNGNGGGIYNTGGHVDIVESTVSDNTASNSGGGVYNGWLGSIDADHSRISGNAATSGGGVANSGGSVTVRRSRVAADAALSRGVVGNQATRSGGAVHNWYGFVAIRGVDLVGNTAAVGGAISNDVGATVKVKRSTLVDNEASATGGAIFTAGGQTIVRDSAVQDNSATRGGGVHALLGTIEVHDSSVSLNTASEQGGGVALGSVNQSDARGNLEVGPTATFRHSDIDGNQGGGIHASAGTALDVKWVRVRDNTGSGIIAEDPGALVPFVEVEIRKSKVKRNTHHGVEVAGALIVKNSTISQNHRSGISLRGTARVATTTIANNHAAAWIGCGRTETRLVMRDVNVRDNEPNGGVYMACGTALIVGSRFVRNHDALEGGGAFYATASAAVEVVDTTFRNNRAQGPSGPVHGGAILNEAEMRLDGVTVTRNVSSGHGGGIHNSGVLEVINSTLSGNESRRRGGGLAASNTGMDQAPHTTLEHVTITNNSGGRRAGGLSATGGGLLAIFGSVVAGNAMNGQPDVDVSGSVSMTSGYNVYGGCCDFIWSATDLLDVADARLGPLRDNGGPTATHSLLASSPAIDLVPVSECRVWNDQRGVERPLGLGCDAGSFEF